MDRDRASGRDTLTAGLVWYAPSDEAVYPYASVTTWLIATPPFPLAQPTNPNQQSGCKSERLYTRFLGSVSKKSGNSPDRSSAESLMRTSLDPGRRVLADRSQMSARRQPSSRFFQMEPAFSDGTLFRWNPTIACFSQSSSQKSRATQPWCSFTCAVAFRPVVELAGSHIELPNEPPGAGRNPRSAPACRAEPRFR
jgi:hypothetical protein